MVHDDQTQIIANAACRVGVQQFLANYISLPFIVIPTSFLNFKFHLFLVILCIKQASSHVLEFAKAHFNKLVVFKIKHNTFTS